jgi:hypothetical protein
MSDLQTVSITVGILTACITVIIGVISFVRSNRRAEEQRNTQLFMELYETYRSTEFRNQMYTFMFHRDPEKDYGERYGPGTNIQALSNDAALFAYYDGIGFLVRNGLLNMSYVEQLLSSSIILVWEKIQSSWSDDERGRYSRGSPVWSHFEYLYNELKQRQQATISTS